MNEFELKLEQMKEMVEAIQSEFYDEDGSHFGTDCSNFSAVGWVNWLDMANEALGFRWTRENMQAMAKSLVA